MRLFHALKRGSDVAVAGGLLLVGAPLFLLVGVAVKMDSPGPAIFRQTRLGRGGKPFTIYKFRTMTVDAEAGGVYEAERDHRVTRVGRVLRKTSIDELPQLVNILTGDMSIIGPRPVLTYHPWPLEHYTPHQRRRFDVRPGVTGWAQVNGRKSVEWPDRLDLDVEYVDGASFAMDMRIMGLTVVKVLSMSDNVNTSRTAGGPGVGRGHDDEAAGRGGEAAEDSRE